MIIIRAVIHFGHEGIFASIKSVMGILNWKIKEYKGEKVLYVKTGKRVRKKSLERLLLKKRVRFVAVTPSVAGYEEYLSLSRFSLIKEDKLLISLASETVIRLSRSMGIKKGKVVLGIYSGIYGEKLLNNMKTAADYFSEIYIYGKRSGRRAEAAQSFFNETGISVILSEEIKPAQCHILVAEGDIPAVSDFSGGVIRIGGKPFGRLCVTGLRLELPEELSDENLPDCVICELYNISPKIRKLIVEKNKN